jgi:hypothetical protein
MFFPGILSIGVSLIYIATEEPGRLIALALLFAGFLPKAAHAYIFLYMAIVLA